MCAHIYYSLNPANIHKDGFYSVLHTSVDHYYLHVPWKADLDVASFSTMSVMLRRVMLLSCLIFGVHVLTIFGMVMMMFVLSISMVLTLLNTMMITMLMIRVVMMMIGVMMMMLHNINIS